MFRKLLPALAAPLLLVAACGSSSDALRVETASPAAALQQAPDAAQQAGSAHVDLTMTMSMPSSAAPLEITGSGDYDADAGRASMQIDLGSAVAQLGRLGGDDVPKGLDKPMRFIVDGTTAYVDMPFLGALTGTTGWLSLPLDQVGKTGMGGLGGFGAGADPSAVLDYLRGAGEVKEAGHEEIDGIATTKYTATVDLEKALAKVPADQRAALQGQIDGLGPVPTELPVTVWVDGDGLPRRMEVTLEVPQAGKVRMELHWSKYGEPVTVDVPSPDEVTPATEVLGGMAASLFGDK